MGSKWFVRQHTVILMWSSSFFLASSSSLKYISMFLINLDQIMDFIFPFSFKKHDLTWAQHLRQGKKKQPSHKNVASDKHKCRVSDRHTPMVAQPGSDQHSVTNQTRDGLPQPLTQHHVVCHTSPFMTPCGSPRQKIHYHSSQDSLRAAAATRSQ